MMMNTSLVRIWAMTIYYLRVNCKDPIRVFELLFWPFLSIVIWGFAARWMTAQAHDEHVFLLLLSATIGWQFVRRTNFDFSKRLYDELTGRTVVHVFASPLTPLEWAAGVMAMSSIFFLIFMLFCIVTAALFFQVNIIAKPYVILFWGNLFLAGCALGLVATGFLVYYGRRYLWLIELIGWLFAPLSGAFYPLSVLPKPLYYGARLLPFSYPIDGIRALYGAGIMDWRIFFFSLAMSSLYLLFALLFFLCMYGRSKDKGLMRLTD